MGGQARTGIIPAYAGSTSGSLPRGRTSTDHPRIRGEHRLDIPWPQAMQGSSPHTRGTLPASPSLAGRVADHPRIRGEHSPCLRARTIATGSSPHTRGALVRLPADEDAVGIIPAYAGSTLPCCWRARSVRDHPRIRGEHKWDEFLLMSRLGSSPHTRGAQWCMPYCSGCGRIIPAYAGSTLQSR